MTHSYPTRISDDQHNNAPALPVAWWIPKAEQFCLAKPSGERPFAKAWEPLYAAAPAVPQGFKPVGYLRSDEFDGHKFEPINGEWPFDELLFSATPAPAPAQEPMPQLAALSAWKLISEDGDGQPNHGDIVLCEMAEGQARHTINFGFEVVQWDENFPIDGVVRWILLNRLPETQADFLLIDRLESAPAQEVSDKHEREMLEVINERDRINEWADQLADAIAKHTGYEIGEHTSENNPWRMALNALVCHEAKQEVGLTEAERVRCLIASGCIGTVKMTYDSGPYEITRTSINASRLIDAIIAALRAKGGK